MLLAAAGPLSAEAEGARGRKGGSRPGLRLPRGLPPSKSALPGGERSSGELGVEAEEPRGARGCPGGLPAALARGARPAPSPSSRPPPMMAGSRLRVWRSLRFERLLAAAGAAAAAGEEQEKTLLSRLCADIAAAAAPSAAGTDGGPGSPGSALSLLRRGPTAAAAGSWRRRPRRGCSGAAAAAAVPLLGEEGGKKTKKKKVTREKGWEGGSLGGFISARRCPPASLPPRPRRVRDRSPPLGSRPARGPVPGRPRRGGGSRVAPPRLRAPLVRPRSERERSRESPAERGGEPEHRSGVRLRGCRSAVGRDPRRHSGPRLPSCATLLSFI